VRHADIYGMCRFENTTKQGGRESEHSLPSNDEVNYAWNYTSTPHTPLWRGA